MLNITIKYNFSDKKKKRNMKFLSYLYQGEKYLQDRKASKIVTAIVYLNHNKQISLF